MCLFCKIADGEIPCEKVYEDRDVLAFLDIAPVNYGHTLVIPKKHFENLEEIDEETLMAVIKAVKKVGKAVKEGMGVEGYNLCMNNGKVAGQVVPHAHFHIMPRNERDGYELWHGGKYGDNEAEEVMNKIKQAL